MKKNFSKYKTMVKAHKLWTKERFQSPPLENLDIQVGFTLSIKTWSLRYLPNFQIVWVQGCPNLHLEFQTRGLGVVEKDTHPTSSFITVYIRLLTALFFTWDMACILPAAYTRNIPRGAKF